MINLQNCVSGIVDFLKINLGPYYPNVIKGFPEDDTKLKLPTIAVDMIDYVKSVEAIGENLHTIHCSIGIYARNDLEKHQLIGYITNWLFDKTIQITDGTVLRKGRTKNASGAKTREGQLIYQRTQGEIMFDVNIREYVD